MENDKKYCIYIHINKTNNKVYVGQTCQKPEYRWNHGQGYKECSYFYNAILKYGWDNFEHKILETNLSQERANQLECYYIKYYNANNSAYGYNIQQGGNSHIFNEMGRTKCSERSKKFWQNSNNKEKMSEIMKEKWKDPEFQEKQKIARAKKKPTLSEEGRKRISESRKEYIKKYGTPTQGKGHTPEAKEKIRQSKIGNKNPQYGKTTSAYQKQRASEIFSKPIKCIETQQIFNSSKEAAIWCGLKSSSGFSDYFAGRKKSCGKHPDTNIKLHWEKIL